MTQAKVGNRWSLFLDSLDQTGHNEHHDRFSQELWDHLSATGVFKAFRGASADNRWLETGIGRMRELGRKNSDRGLTFSAVTQLASTIYCLSAFASPSLQERYLPSAEAGISIGGHAITEENAGSDVMSMTTTATKQGDYYVLNGTKRFITNAPIANTLVIYAKTVEDGVEKGLSAFLVETAWTGVDTSEVMDTAGLRSSPIGQVVLDDVRVPIDNRIGHTGAGLLILDQVMKREILLAFAGNVGDMERLVARSVKHVNERVQFGSSIGRNQLVANRIVETQIAIELGGALIDSIVKRIDGFEDITIPVAAAKIFISEANVSSALSAIQVQGGSGYLAASSLPCELLDAVPSAIYSGANDLLRMKIAIMLGVTV